MKISELMAFVDAVKPNAFPTSAKVAWLNEVEGMVWTEVMLLSPLEFKPYIYDESTGEGDSDLLVAPPHSKLYNVYLSAMIDFYNGEYDKYQNGITLFNAHYNEFMSWYALHYRPADGNYRYMGEYISAYGIAVKHGFEGTEEEWLNSLKASDGVVDDDIIRDAVNDYLAENPITAPVTSVNGRTGAINLTAADVGALDKSNLGNAVDEALSQAKASGEFDGSDGVDGADGYTPQKGTDYFDGQDGKDGVGIASIKQTTTSTASGGKNVITVTLTNGTTSTFTVYNGAKGDDGTGGSGGGTGEDSVSVTNAYVDGDGYLQIELSNGDTINAGYVIGADGKDGTNGKDGTSVTVKSVTNNTGDGQTNTVTFSDGKTLKVKNGSKGADGQDGANGKDGVSVTNAEVDPHGELQITLSSGQKIDAGYVMGSDGYTPVKGEDYFDGVGISSIKQTTTSTASGGKNVITVTLTNGTTSTFTVYNGAKGADGTGGSGGGTGEDGISVTNAYVDTDGYLQIELSDGNVINAGYVKGKDGVRGQNGQDGADGDGVSYAYVEENGHLMIELTTGEVLDCGYVIGADGKDGTNGKDGQDGTNGKDGTSVTVSSVTNNTGDGQTNTVTFSDGKKLTVKNGSKGSDGQDGADGYTPVKGTDYWTDDDKAEMVSDVLAALPTWTGGSY